MKIKTTGFLMFALISILPYVGEAMPGIEVTTDPLSNTTADGITIDYKVIITNQDDCCSKTITSLDMVDPQSGWLFNFEPSLVGETIPAGSGSSIITTLKVTVPSGVTSGQTISHEIYTNADAVLCDGDFCFSLGPDEDYEFFNTIVTEATQIPEFPTVALPVISALGIVLLMSRRKGRN